MGTATGVVYASFLKSVATSSHVVFPQRVNVKSGNDHSQSYHVLTKNGWKGASYWKISTTST